MTLYAWKLDWGKTAPCAIFIYVKNELASCRGQNSADKRREPKTGPLTKQEDLYV